MDAPLVYPLADRGIISVAGPDRAVFLQGLISNDIEKITKEPSGEGAALYAAFLTPQGKFRHAFLVFNDPAQERFLIDCKGGEDLFDLGRGLRRHLLREDVKLTIAKDLSVYAFFHKDGTPVNPAQARSFFPETSAIIATDPRSASLGLRILAPPDALQPIPHSDDIQNSYTRLRIAEAVPEAPYDLVQNKSLLLESGFDDLNGISWDKGCYMGQELTARTRYRGLVRRRLVPMTFDQPDKDPVLPPHSPVYQADKQVGETRSTSTRSTLALIDVTAFQQDSQEKADFFAHREDAPPLLLIPAPPDWLKAHLSTPEKSKKARSTKPAVTESGHR